MTVHFVTTGKSLRTHARCWQVPRGFRVSELDETDTEDLDPENLRELRKTTNSIFSLLEADGGNALDLVQTYFRFETWRPGKGRLLSAELNTILRMFERQPQGSSLIPDGDEIHLLLGKSNREEGLLLKAILEKLSTKFFPNVRIDKSGPYDWDPVNDARFETGMQYVQKCIDARVPNRNDEISFILTGGYKAVLIDLARWLGFDRRNASLHYIFEEPPAELIKVRIRKGERKRSENVAI